MYIYRATGTPGKYDVVFRGNTFINEKMSAYPLVTIVAADMAQFSIVFEDNYFENIKYEQNVPMIQL